jgi:hypothetical protein
MECLRRHVKHPRGALVVCSNDEGFLPAIVTLVDACDNCSTYGSWPAPIFGSTVLGESATPLTTLHGIEN